MDDFLRNRLKSTLDPRSTSSSIMIFTLIKTLPSLGALIQPLNAPLLMIVENVKNIFIRKIISIASQQVRDSNCRVGWIIQEHTYVPVSCV